MRHLANSAATLTLPEAHFDLVRPGIAVYGLSPVPPERLRARPGDDAARGGRAGEAGPRGRGRLVRPRVHDHARHHAGARPARVRRRGAAARDATSGRCGSTAGASRSPDGSAWTRSSSTSAICRWRQATAVVLFGTGRDGEPTAQDWADAVGTIHYEIVTRIGPRVTRVYVGARSMTGRMLGPGRRPALACGCSWRPSSCRPSTTLRRSAPAGVGAAGGRPRRAHRAARRRQDRADPGHRPRAGRRGPGRVADLRHRARAPAARCRSSTWTPTGCRSLGEVDDLDLDFDSADVVTVVEWGAGLVEQVNDARLEIVLDRAPTTTSAPRRSPARWRLGRPADDRAHRPMTAVGPPTGDVRPPIFALLT